MPSGPGSIIGCLSQERSEGKAEEKGGKESERERARVRDSERCIHIITIILQSTVLAVQHFPLPNQSELQSTLAFAGICTLFVKRFEHGLPRSPDS